MSFTLRASGGGSALRDGSSFRGTVVVSLAATFNGLSSISANIGHISLAATLSGTSSLGANLLVYLPEARGLKVTLAGQDISAWVNELSIDIENILGQGPGTTNVGPGTSSTIQFDCSLGPTATALGAGQAIPPGTPRLVRQGELKVWDAYGNLIFGGYASKMDDITPKLQNITTIYGVDYWQDLDRVILNDVYASQSDTQIIRAVLATYAPWIDTSLVPTNQNYFFVKRKWTAKSVRKVLTDICDVTGFLAWITPDKKLHYVNPEALNTAPFFVSDTPDTVASFGHRLTKYEQDDNAIINRVMFYGGRKTTTDFTQDISTQANGSNTTFVLAYEPHESSDGHYHVHVAGVDLVVGLATGNTTLAANILKSQGGLADVLIDPTNYTLTFNVAPNNTGPNSVTATYRYTAPLVVLVTNSQSFSFFGRYFDGTISDSSVYDQQTAMQRCRVLLAEQAYGLLSMELVVRKAGLYPGQMLHVVNAVRGINASFQIQKVVVKPYGGGLFEYTVSLGAWNWDMVDMLMQAALAGAFDDTALQDTTDPIQDFQYQQNIGTHVVVNYKTNPSGQYYAHAVATGSGDAYCGLFTITS